MSLQTILDDIREMSVFEFAGSEWADCASPDNESSAGAKFLQHVVDDTVELIESAGDSFDADTIDDDGSVGRIADNAPNVYTSTKWAQFVDLAAWQEDVSELAGEETNLDKLASIALYMIAERLATAICRSVDDELAGEAVDDDEEV